MTRTIITDRCKWREIPRQSCKALRREKPVPFDCAILEAERIEDAQEEGIKEVKRLLEARK